MQTKAQVRLQVEQKLSEVSLQQKQEKSEDIVTRLEELFTAIPVQNVLVFFPLSDEPDIRDFYVFLENKGCNLYLPNRYKLSFNTYGEVASEYEDPMFKDLRAQNQDWNSDFERFGTVILPGRAFTTAGKRLGRGAGWYDRALRLCTPETNTIGVCYQEQIYPDLPTEAHDIQVDQVVAA